MIITNIDVKNELANGTVGKLIHVEANEEGLVKTIWLEAVGDIAQPLQPQAIATLTNRRRPTIDGSASYTEATESPKNSLAQRQRGVSRPAFAMPRSYGGNQAARSNSLPRVRMSEMDFRRFQQIRNSSLPLRPFACCPMILSQTVMEFSLLQNYPQHEAAGGTELNRVPLGMDFTEINSRGKRGELWGRIDRQNFRFRTAKTTIIKFGLHASFVELESAKSALNEPGSSTAMATNSWQYCRVVGSNPDAAEDQSNRRTDALLKDLTLTWRGS
ncbi:rho GTPase-activating protein 100F [Trichonephila clavipes]|nr:rho GTPase-activating protein 100F [Trichonephila clavipes]